MVSEGAKYLQSDVGLAHWRVGTITNQFPWTNRQQRRRDVRNALSKHIPCRVAVTVARTNMYASSMPWSPHRAQYTLTPGLFGTAYNRILDGEKRADEKIPPNAWRFSRFCQTQRQQNAKFVLRPVKSGKRLLARFSVPRVPSKRVSWTRKQTGP